MSIQACGYVKSNVLIISRFQSLISVESKYSIAVYIEGFISSIYLCILVRTVT